MVLLVKSVHAPTLPPEAVKRDWNWAYWALPLGVPEQVKVTVSP